MNPQRSLTAKVRRLARKLGAVNTSDQDGVMATLKIARRLVDEGWCQGAYFRLVDDAPQYDITGAVRKAAVLAAPKDAARAEYAARRALFRAMLKSHDRLFVTLEELNDWVDTTKKDILDLFDLAILNQGKFGVALAKGPQR